MSKAKKNEDSNRRRERLSYMVNLIRLTVYFSYLCIIDLCRPQEKILRLADFNRVKNYRPHS